MATARPSASGDSLPPIPTGPMDPVLERILDDARWAPSGDNAQPWRFEVLGTDEVVVHLNDRDLSVYEYREAEPVRLSGGILLESMRIAASAQGRTASWQIEAGDRPSRITVRFAADPGVSADRLYPYLRQRSVNRWPYKPHEERPLRPEERAALDAAIGSDLAIRWYTGAEERRQFADLAALSTAIRLSTPEAFVTHQSIIDWKLQLSPSKIPAGALGLDRATLLGMRLGMKSWRLTRIMNRLGGISMAANQMDHKPINASAAVFAMRLSESGLPPDRRAQAIFRAGQAIQRFWLTATGLDLAMQPALAVLIFADYGEKRIRFTGDVAASRQAAELGAAFRTFFRESTRDFVFMGRIGEPAAAQRIGRSVRRSLAELLVTGRSFGANHGPAVTV